MPAIYLDNNATTPVDPAVLDAMLPFFSTQFGNPASVTHPYGWFAEESVQIAREHVARLIDADPNGIVFVSGATEANNLVLKGISEAHPKGHIISCALEHRSVLDALEHVSRIFEMEVTLLGVNQQGLVSEQEFFDALRPTTVLCSLMLGNNEIGSINSIETLSRVARERGVLFHCDATQALGRLPVSVTKLGVDFLSSSAHKMYGPKGVGAVWIRESAAMRVCPQLHGGGHERGLRSGTLNVPGIVGFGKACELAALGIDREPKQLRNLSAEFFQRLQQTSGEVTLHGPAIEDRLPGNLNLRFPGIDSARLLGAVQTKLALSASSACQSTLKRPSHVLQALGLPEAAARQAIRVGIGRFTDQEQLARAAEILTQAVTRLARH